MTWARVFTLVALLAACTKPNEAKHCTAGTCTTPDFPFCGYIRINTRDGSYTKASTTIESGILTTGSIGTR